MTGSSFLNVTTRLDPSRRLVEEVSARRQRSYFSTKASQLSELSLSREPNYSARELSPDTWPDFDKLFSKHGGVGGCWCMYYQRPRGGTMKGLTPTKRRAKNKRDKKSLVDDGRSHGAFLYDRERPNGWCKYGLKEEFAPIDNGKNDGRLDLEDESER